jgi:hypothetical protein
MEDEQIDAVDAELDRALVKRVQSFVVAIVGDPDLGLDEDLRRIEPRTTNALADLRSFEYAAAVSMWR